MECKFRRPEDSLVEAIKKAQFPRQTSSLPYEGEITLSGRGIWEYHGHDVPMIYGHNRYGDITPLLLVTVAGAFRDQFGRDPEWSDLIGATVQVSRVSKFVDAGGKKKLTKELQVKFLG